MKRSAREFATWLATATNPSNAETIHNTDPASPPRRRIIRIDPDVCGSPLSSGPLRGPLTWLSRDPFGVFRAERR